MEFTQNWQHYASPPSHQLNRQQCAYRWAIWSNCHKEGRSSHCTHERSATAIGVFRQVCQRRRSRAKAPRHLQQQRQVWDHWAHCSDWSNYSTHMHSGKKIILDLARRCRREWRAFCVASQYWHTGFVWGKDCAQSKIPAKHSRWLPPHTHLTGQAFRLSSFPRYVLPHRVRNNQGRETRRREEGLTSSWLLHQLPSLSTCLNVIVGRSLHPTHGSWRSRHCYLL